jgi:predicted DNA-binding protein
MTPPKLKTKSVPVGPIRFPVKQYNDLTLMAQRDGRTLSGYIRRAVSEKVERDKVARYIETV